jgi:inositol transport system substrate-binding protein
MKDKVIVVSIDAIADALQAVKKGNLDATVFQDARKQGAGAIETAIKLAQGQKVEKEVLIPFKLLTKGDVDQYLK